MKSKPVLLEPKRRMPWYPEGLTSTWKRAIKVARKSGRIAILPDIINARLATEREAIPWQWYFTTASAEYMGFSRGGSRIIIVAHGIGPLATLNGILEAYSYEYQDKKRVRKGGRISEQEFRNLESGKYGKVHIVDLVDVLSRYRWPFIEHLTVSQAVEEPLLRARFGPRAGEYIERHAQISRKYHQEDGHEVSNPFILEMCGAGYRRYEYSVGYEDDNQLENGCAFAHLLSIGGLHTIGLGVEVKYPQSPCLSCDVSCHDWWHGTMFAGVRRSTVPKQAEYFVCDDGYHSHYKTLIRSADGFLPSGRFRPCMETSRSFCR